MGSGLWIAYCCIQQVRGQELFRVLLFLPYITSTVASAAVWSYLYSPDNGLLNAALRLVGLPAQQLADEPPGVFCCWRTVVRRQRCQSGLQGPSLALVSLSIFTTWVFVGYDITIFLAGLGNIPPSCTTRPKSTARAAGGCSATSPFRCCRRRCSSCLIFTVIGTFKAFNHIWVMTEGGPGNATTTASVLIFQQLYQNNRYGYSAALAFILFAVILLLTVVQNHFAGRRVVYD